MFFVPQLAHELTHSPREINQGKLTREINPLTHRICPRMASPSRRLLYLKRDRQLLDALWRSAPLLSRHPNLFPANLRFVGDQCFLSWPLQHLAIGIKGRTMTGTHKCTLIGFPVDETTLVGTGRIDGSKRVFGFRSPHNQQRIGGEILQQQKPFVVQLGDRTDVLKFRLR